MAHTPCTKAFELDSSAYVIAQTLASGWVGRCAPCSSEVGGVVAEPVLLLGLGGEVAVWTPSSMKGIAVQLFGGPFDGAFMLSALRSLFAVTAIVLSAYPFDDNSKPLPRKSSGTTSRRLHL